MTTLGTPPDPAVRRRVVEADSLPEALLLRARERPDDTAYVFLADGERPADSTTYRQLDLAARSRAGLLGDHAGRGSSALLMYPAGVEFVRALLGCMYAGVAGAPVPVPTRERGLERIRRIADDAGTSLVLTVAEVRDELLARFGDSPFLAGLRLVATDEAPAARPAAPPTAIDPDAVALLQYTSGSTGDPKGVEVTHANFRANVLETDGLWPCAPDGVLVSWLPHFHDMGMMFGVVLPLWAGAPSYLMAPAAFVRRPGRWLEAISRYRGTHSAAPSFAYELCVREARQQGAAPGVDLSSWRVAANGAEPVRWSVVDEFVRTFAPFGFAGRAMCPGYGLAENTLKATGSRQEDEPTVIWLDDDALRENRVETRRGPGGGAVPLVGAGVPVGETRLRVVDPASGWGVPDGTVGEVWINGPCVASGYHGRPEESREVFRARIVGEPKAGTFLRTGDLGFLRRGELFLTGRLKDVIIRKGRNFYPQDIELSAERSHEGLHPNSVAAFSVDDGTSERLVVVVEADGRVLRDCAPEALRERVRLAVHEGQRLPVDEVVVVRRGALPKTSSGKVQRRACRARYLEDAWSPAGIGGGR
ncbi:fatty acyl-AMP ligase [Streptomyces sedi]|uniref:Fatty acyl-AMP ligase n=1 Tax=Streptomyces sedi TaxID=555059 RepID=A0A5C4V695_9ACTN|nr:fatty acyl-AMP ligase [Streptomyces sedi]TNM30589.1 fatty acyl-AMP ligase [Streptomyces sedi]